MNVGSIMDAIGEALEGVEGVVAVYDYVPSSVEVPCAFVDFPERVEYDQTYGRGSDRAVFPVGLVVSKVDDREARLKLGGFFVDIKAALDGNLGGSCDSARVTEAQVLRITFGNIDYLTVVFLVEVYT